jgi:hypothetical protein
MRGSLFVPLVLPARPSESPVRYLPAALSPHHQTVLLQTEVPGAIAPTDRCRSGAGRLLALHQNTVADLAEQAVAIRPPASWAFRSDERRKGDLLDAD